MLHNVREPFEAVPTFHSTTIADILYRRLLSP